MARLLKRLLDAPPSGQDDGVRAIQSGIDIIGDIAILRYDPSFQMSDAGEAILKAIKNVRAVYGQQGGIEGEFRLRRLKHLAGEERTVTTHKENGCQFRVDVEKCYFSPRLSSERMRIAEAVRDGEKVLNMFAGVGPFSIAIAKRRDVLVYSSELNKTAYEYHLENNKLNKVTAKMRMMNEDASNLPSLLDLKFDRVLMPHPSRADRFMDAALALIRKGGVIHYYRHLSSENFQEARGIIADEVRSAVGDNCAATIRKVREVGKRYLELVADIVVS